MSADGDLRKQSMQGHRKRLRERFLASGLSGFQDYEIIELLLTLGTPRKDCKLPAKEVINKFGSISNALSAPVDELRQIKGIGPMNVFGLKLVQALSGIYYKDKLNDSLKLNSPDEVYAYLKEKIGYEKKEHVVVLFFDSKNNLIIDDVSVGTLNASLMHPRELFNKAVLKNASHVLVAHNHPSGDSTPSTEDITVTKRLIQAGKILGINVVDHMVISSSGYTSIREEHPSMFSASFC